MKALWFSRTKGRYYLILVPPVAMAVVSVLLSPGTKSTLAFYPMAAAFAGLSVYAFLYFFRLARFAYDDVRTIGFRSNEKVILKAGKTLIFTLEKKNYLRFEVVGNDGQVAGLDWLSGEAPNDFRQLCTTIVGNEKAVRRALRFYQAEVTDDLFGDAPVKTHTEFADLEADFTPDGRRQVRVKMLVNFNPDGSTMD